MGAVAAAGKVFECVGFVGVGVNGADVSSLCSASLCFCIVRTDVSIFPAGDLKTVFWIRHIADTSRR